MYGGHRNISSSSSKPWGLAWGLGYGSHHPQYCIGLVGIRPMVYYSCLCLAANHAWFPPAFSKSLLPSSYVHVCSVYVSCAHACAYARAHHTCAHQGSLSGWLSALFSGARGRVEQALCRWTISPGCLQCSLPETQDCGEGRTQDCGEGRTQALPGRTRSELTNSCWGAPWGFPTLC